MREATAAIGDAAEVSRRWGCEQVILIGIDSRGTMQMATWGRDRTLCRCARVLGDEAWAAIEKRVGEAEEGAKEF